MKYRSRISVIITIFILGVMFMPFIDGVNSLAKLISIAIPLLLTVLILTTVNYTIVGKYLIIRTLWFKMATIDIVGIKSIKRSYNPLSSPAASLKRLEVKFYHKGRVESALISPVREDEFIAKLKEVNPRIDVRIVRRRSVARFWDWDI